MTAILVTCKSVINGSFLVIYLQIAELYPTSHRASGAGFSSVVASIFGISGPYIAYSVSFVLHLSSSKLMEIQLYFSFSSFLVFKLSHK